MSLFPKTPKWSPKIGILVVPEFWRLISFSNQVDFENVTATYYSLQKNLSNNV
jgi:hypothetical protein